MKKAPIPHSEVERVIELKKYQILDSKPQEVYTEIARLASIIFNSKFSAISFFEGDRQWFKATVGFVGENTDAPRDISFCGHVVGNAEKIIVEDTTKNVDFADNPYCLNEPHLRFYAGVPIKSSRGIVLGSLCVFDNEVHSKQDFQLDALESLARSIENLLELRIKNLELEKIIQQSIDIQKISKTGGWELDVITGETSWTDQLFDIYNIPRGSIPKAREGISFYAESEKDKITNYVNRCISHKEAYDDVFEFYDSKGILKWVRAIGKPIEGPNGEVHKLVGTFQDITQQIEINKELEKQKNIVHHNAKLASIGELAAGVGHEVNNPLTIIKGFVTAIKKKYHSVEDIDFNELIDYLNKIENSSDRIATIVKGLRTYSRSDKKDLSSFDMIETIDETVSMIKGIYQSENVAFEVIHKSKGESCKIMGNRGKIQQVLMNLFSNAKDATVGQKRRSIKVISDVKEDKFICSVEDNGQGIDNNSIDKIFDPFFTTKEVDKGTGIGLSISRNLIKEHNGEIEVKSSGREGTCFSFSIPISHSSEKTQGSTKENASHKNFHLKALVVDDEPDIITALKILLESFGVEVITAGSAKSALSFLENKKKVHFIISDIKMPDMDGVEFFKRIKSNSAIEKPFLVFYTGGVINDFEDLSSTLSDICDDYFYKPFSEHKIEKILSNVYLNSLMSKS